ncbi:COBRA-like protein 7 [Triticum dicoccoides]|uniref:COBRA-like protein 7 n=1 Tax=Triticum dicoccoides TaxID=85692 RepID=UPI001890BFA1|nr:COBRA-like protein 7 [Triticum dicoccoides]XP_037455057.1 COBRA-like protein 7 [Triticum dicoccoides]
MMDLGPGTPYNLQVANCCRGGVLSSLVQNSKAATSTFRMIVGNFAPSSDGGPQMPFNFSIGVPGYTCSNATVVPPSRTQFDKQRHIQALMTWQVLCFYSQTVAAPRKSCCVSLFTFYSSVVVECPRCICGACPVTSMAPQCKGPKAEPAARCTGHMCPIQVHWHIKKSYREYWRVKMTVNNFNTLKNFSDWNLLVQHPGMQNLTEVFSFNHHPLVQYGTINDTELFWGLPNFNTMLLQDGYVQSEILLRKGQDFTFDAGWAFPRKMYFDGGECAMPPPDDYPPLPSASCDQRLSAVLRSLLAGLVLLFLLF